MKNKLLDILFLILGIVCIGVLVYIPVSQYIHYLAGVTEIYDFARSAEEISDKEIGQRMRLAEAYNQKLRGGNIAITDPFTEAELEEGERHYAWMLEVKHQIGTIIIPKINQQIPIRAGTSEEVLQKGAGHIQNTSLPIGGNTTHAVITAHRGLPNQVLFTDLNLLEKGDRFFVDTIGGRVAYDVVETKIVEPTEISVLELQENKDMITLLTCTPYGINSHRLLVIGERGEYVPEKDDVIIEESKNSIPQSIQLWFWVNGTIIVVFLIVIFKPKGKKHEED